MGAKGAAIAGAAGEGVVGAGSAAEQIRQQTADGELTAKQAALAAGTGLATGALGFAGNKVANRLGIGDADMMLAQGTKGMAKDAAERATAAAVNPLAQPAQKSILRQMGEGAITEGVLEELPQSVSEQILQNEVGQVLERRPGRRHCDGHPVGWRHGRRRCGLSRLQGQADR
jgi:hypothetical protein